MSAKPTLLQLLDALQDPLSAEWYTLGLRLGYDAGKLNIIRENNHHVVEHCMRDLLTLWLQKYPKKGWGDIADALREMDKNDVADKIARQYNLPSPAAGIYIQWEAVKPGLDWTGFWTGFWTQLYYVIGQCKHGVTVHV